MKMEPLSLHAIESFIKKNQIATQSKSKEVRFSLAEMNEIAWCLASVTTRLMALTEEHEQSMLEIHALRLQLNTGETRFDGGGFKE